jgi:4-hydroxy-tetrahydrodipicolinate synthase
VAAVVRAGAGRVPVLAGVAALGTADARADATSFAAEGADAILASAPFGFELSQRELSGHFRAMAAAAPGVPIMAYEVPSRVKVSLGTGLVSELLGDGVIAGLKDSSGNIGAARLRSGALRGVPWLHYTGAEECIDAFLLGGGNGSVPGLANVFPQFHLNLSRRAARGDWAGAREAQDLINQLLDLYFHPLPDASFSAQFFAIVKEALRQRGVIEGATTSVPFLQADQSLVQHVAAFLEFAAAAVEPKLKALP